jgi:type I restriction enzyme R subunit
MNQSPEEIERDKIDKALKDSGWLIQKKKATNLYEGPGVAVREDPTESGLKISGRT